MTFKELGHHRHISFDRHDISSFNSCWPGSPIPEKRITFRFDESDNLVDTFPDISSFGGDALDALVQDAKAYAARHVRALECLREVRAKLGRRYKEAIRGAWFDGHYRSRGLDEWDGRLQSIRNRLGPTWLDRARL